MKFCIAGQNQIAVEAMKFVLHKYPAAKIYTIPNEKDNGEDGWQPSLRKAASKFECRIRDIENINHENIDVFFSLECDKIIDINKISCKKIFNIHFSLLPNYKGVYTSAWPILNGEDESGVTLHVVEEKIDGGPIIDQISFKLDLNETALTLYDKYQAYGLVLFMRNIESIISENFHAVPQKHIGSYYSKSSINYRNLKLNFDVDANNLSRQIRAFYFPSFQVPKIYDHSITNPRITNVVSVDPPGSFRIINDHEIVISSETYDVICSLVK